MVDLYTYFIYLTLLSVLIGLTSYKTNKRMGMLDLSATPKLKSQHILALLAISFVIGFRYEVGVDWFTYHDYFNLIKDRPYISFTDQNMEVGYFYINKFIARTGLSYEYMFFIVGFVSWYFIFKSLPNTILPLLIFFLFADEHFFWSLNGVRQFAAISIWLVAIREIINKKFIRYLLLIMLGSLFHKTILVFIPFYFIPFNRLYKIKIWVILFIVSFIIGSSSFFISFIESLVVYLGQSLDFIGSYSKYIGSKHLTINEEIQTGLGYIFRLLVDFTIIILSGVVIKKLPKANIYFVLFFFGTILFNLSYNIQLLGRINGYFLIFRTIVLALLVIELWQKTKYKIFVFAFCFLYFIFFLFSIYNSSNMCSPYNFTF